VRLRLSVLCVIIVCIASVSIYCCEQIVFCCCGVCDPAPRCQPPITSLLQRMYAKLCCVWCHLLCAMWITGIFVADQDT
jgi:hypothetical protein